MNSFFIETFYLFFEGILLFQSVFFCMAYFIAKRRDVLYYALLNLLTAIYFLLNAPETFFGIASENVFQSTLYPYVNFALLLGLILFYILFLKEIFVDTFLKYNYVKNIFIGTCYVIATLYLLFALFTYLGWPTDIIFYAGYMVSSPFCFAIMLLNFRVKGYKSLIIYAMYVSFICLVLTLIFTIRFKGGSTETLLDKYPLALIKVSMLIDIILFQLALLKSWNEREKQLALEKLLSQLAVEKLRNQISGELHDDIGSALSGVSMYSHLTNKQLENGELDNVKTSLQIIQKSTDEMVDKLGDLVWSVNPRHETIEFLLDRIKQFANEMCAAKNIVFTCSIPKNIAQYIFSQERMHHLYLIIKEAVNNAVKYSGATALTLDIKEANGLLNLVVIDNGSGFEVNNIQQGNGLAGMKKRTAEIGAVFNLQTAIGKGTGIYLTVKYPNEV